MVNFSEIKKTFLLDLEEAVTNGLLMFKRVSVPEKLYSLSI